MKLHTRQIVHVFCYLSSLIMVGSLRDDFFLCELTSYMLHLFLFVGKFYVTQAGSIQLCQCIS